MIDSTIRKTRHSKKDTDPVYYDQREKPDFQGPGRKPVRLEPSRKSREWWELWQIQTT